MGFIRRLFRSRIHETCLAIYAKARKMRPGKPERDYLKLVLLTKPPFDYQHDKVIDFLLDEFPDIDSLASYISKSRPTDPNLGGQWATRRRNVKVLGKQLKERNRRFFEEFWTKLETVEGDPNNEHDQR